MLVRTVMSESLINVMLKNLYEFEFGTAWYLKYGVYHKIFNLDF